MITKSDTAHLELFTSANNILSEHDLLQNQITNIDDYFTYIEDLKNLIESTENTDDAVDPIYLILPADEPLFNIDANTRKIEVPQKFATNGIGVQGDEVAEVLYFSIDRYFDIQDLYNKEIYVQWEAPIKANAVGGGDQGLSLTINKSLSFKGGKVVFGWPIGSEITKFPGQVKFSIRFYERGTDSAGKPILNYSFSTLTAVVKIAEGLNFNIADESTITQKIIDKKALIYNNLKNSEATGVSIPALDIVFAMLYPEIDEDTGEEMPNKRSLPEKVDLDSNNEYVLKAQALFHAEDEDYSYGAGNISYNWTFTGKDNVSVSKADTPAYEVTTDSARNAAKLYYYKEILPDKKEKYSLYTGNNFPYDDTLKSNIFEKKGSLIAKNAGYYQVTATNRYGADTSEIESDVCLVPFAVTPTFIIDNPNIIITDEATEIIDLSVTVTAEDNGELTTAWKESVTNNNSTAQDSQVTNSGTGSVVATYSVKVADVGNEGKYYFVNVTNTKNNDTSNSVSDPIRITYPLIKPTLNHKVNNEEKLDLNLYWPDYADTGLIIAVEIEGGRFDGDATRYQWQKRSGGSFVDIPEATEASYTVTAAGSYKCVVSVSYNGDSAEISSSTFAVSNE